MAWVHRNQRRYYYCTARIHGQPRNRYLGTGPEAERCAAEVEQRRRLRTEQTEARRTEAEQHATALAPLEALCVLTDQLLRATLSAAGFHQHARGAWRRRRHGLTPPPPRQDLPE
jgi:hypothetical protein